MAIRICKDQRYGLIDDHSNILLSCSYHDIGAFRNGLAKVRQKNLWGLVDESGGFVVPVQYDKIKQLSCGRIKVKKDGKYGLLNHEAAELIPCEYHIRQISDRLFRVEKDGKYGLYNTDGVPVLPCVYDRIEKQWGNALVGFSPTAWMRVEKAGLFGIADTEGQLIVPPIYRRISTHRSAVTPEGVSDLLDLSGTVIHNCGFRLVSHTGRKLEFCYGIQKDGKWGIFNDYLSDLTEYPWDDIKSYRTEIFVKQEGKWGIVDLHGKLLLDCRWENEEAAYRAYERIRLAREKEILRKEPYL